jgi:hypothetical protein
MIRPVDCQPGAASDQRGFLTQSSEFTQRLARLLKVNESLLSAGERAGASTRRRPRRAQRKTEQVNVEIPILAGTALLEAHCLGILIRRPEMVFHVDRALNEEHLSRISRSDFERAEYQAIFELIEESRSEPDGADAL